jgi:hypothetical protein
MGANGCFEMKKQTKKGLFCSLSFFVLAQPLSFLKFFWAWGLLHKQGARRARARGAPLPRSHNALVATFCLLCIPAGGPSGGSPTTPRAYLCSVEGRPSVPAGSQFLGFCFFFFLSEAPLPNARPCTGPGASRTACALVLVGRKPHSFMCQKPKRKPRFLFFLRLVEMRLLWYEMQLLWFEMRLPTTHLPPRALSC